MAKKKPAVPVDALKHVADSRDPSLDPQLVWKGKDEQDAHPLDVPAVPIYVQEKVHPLALIDDLRRRPGPRERPVQLDLFGDFNGLDDFQKKVEFYQHPQHWTNRLILGDSLLVMTSLAEKERLKGQVQCVYFDPPYGIKFGSNWQVSTRKRDVKDARAEDLTRQPEQIKAFRDTWELGIHSYLTYLRDRLTAARELLTESGSIFVQIGDENVHLVRCLMDEVFGSENFVASIPFRKKTMPLGTNFIEQMADYLLWYARAKEDGSGKPLAKYRPLTRPAHVEGEFHHCWYEMPDRTRHRMTKGQIDNHALLPAGARVYRLKSLEPSGPMKSGMFDYEFGGVPYKHPKNGYGTTPDGLDRLAIAGRLQPEGNRLTFVLYADENVAASLTAPWNDTVGADDKSYTVQTNTEVIKRCLLMTTDPGDLVLDPTCGSGTTAYVAEQWGRRWITIDTSRVALALARTRLMAARFPYYLLADSPAGRKKLNELASGGRQPPGDENRGADAPRSPDIRQGFVYRTIPHVTLRSIANNSGIKEGMTREQIDAAIARHADTETLYDQPYEDKATVRLAGPFTVESLSPHRTLPGGEAPSPPAPLPQGERGEGAGPRNYVQSMLDNLRKAGVKGTVKGQRIEFERLDPLPGEYIQAEGEANGVASAPRDGLAVRVSIGPEFGTVGDQWIKDAALEAIKGSRCDLLLVCAFAFEAGVHEQTAELSREMRLGKLRVLPVRMNPDLAMGDELLKKTGAGHLFTVFGEPDVKIGRDRAGRVTVAVRGVDVFDPTTGAVRSGGTDDVACWFLDTDYDGKSFFVRHAYFCGAAEPYEKLKKALRAEIDEGEWAKLYATVSQPFDPPPGGKIAVKVINHYGDEVLKVFRVG